MVENLAGSHVKRVRTTGLGSRQLPSQPKATKCQLYPTEKVQWQKRKKQTNKIKQKDSGCTSYSSFS